MAHIPTIGARENGFNKIIHLEPYFPTGELTVQPVLLWANGRPCYESHTKYASVGSEYFKTIEPVPGHSFVYMLALGAWERYGENRNGDGFNEFPYKETASPPWITQKDVLTAHYKTFEQYGHNYRHHVNKDPRKAVGKVLRAFWNPTMHRVELLVDLDDAKAPDLAERIAAGEYPPVSMGTRVKFDVCLVCGNRAPTRKQYCDHLRFHMREVINGLRVCALNPSPRFFDISWVFRPADRTAFMLKKVAESVSYDLLSGASAGEYIDAMERQKLAARKLAVMDKIVQGVPVDAKTTGLNPEECTCYEKLRPMVLEAGRNTPDFPDDVLRGMAQYPLSKVFSSLTASGLMQLSTPEITKIVMFRTAPQQKVTDRILDNSVVAQQGIFQLLSEFPQIMDMLGKSGNLNMCPENVHPDIVKKAYPFLQKRAGIGEYLHRKMIPETWRAETPYTTPLTLTDPATRQRYGTTRGAAIRAHDELAKRNLYKVLGGTALLGGAYKVLDSGLGRYGMGKFKPLVALGLGAVGASQWPKMGPHYRTDQGVPVPTMTEMSKISAASPSAVAYALPIFGTLGAMTGLAHDYQSRLQSGIPLGYAGLPLSRRILDRAEEFAHEHPLITGLGGAVALRGAGKSAPVQKLVSRLRALGAPLKEPVQRAARGARETLRGLGQGQKVASWIEEDLPSNESTVLLPEPDLDKIAEWLGWAILEG